MAFSRCTCNPSTKYNGSASHLLILLIGRYCSTSVVRKILGNIIEQTRVHIVRGGEIHDSLPILDYVQRQLGIQSELSGPQAAIDIFAVFIASEVAHEIEVAGVTIFMITRTRNTATMWNNPWLQS